ncbi:MAG TPA: glycine cleavage T C-terminal barrel domain-containing protein [Lacipirellulaceae bacterium]|jgi:folate-binding protein YgfZ
MSSDSPKAVDQYHALREGRGFVELADWSSLTVAGADRQSFLHNFCTNDVRRLTPDQSCEAFFTSVKGKLLGYGLVTCRENELVFITVPRQAPSLLEHLDRYVIREDVSLRDSTAERCYVLLSDDVAHDATTTWLQWDLIGRSTSGLVETAPHELAHVRERLLERGAIRCDRVAFETLRIEAGMPLYGIDFNDANLPQEIGRDKLAISFTKGCYLGQETVARIDALGHVNQRLTGVQFAGADVPQAGAELTHEGRAAGHVTSATFSPRLGVPVALAMLRREALTPGTELISTIGMARVVALPLRDTCAT